MDFKKKPEIMLTEVKKNSMVGRMKLRLATITFSKLTFCKNGILPWKNLTIETFKMGQWPLWNPYAFSGTPHLANFQSAVLSVFPKV